MKRTLVIILLLASCVLFAINGALEVSTDIPNVKIYLNNEYLGETQKFGNINVLSIVGKKPGRYRLVCKQEGYKDRERIVTIPKTGTEKVMVLFLSEDVASSPSSKPGGGRRTSSLRQTSGIRTGSLIVRSRPTGATIYLNNRRIDNLTDTQVDLLNTGNYSVKCAFGDDKVLEGRFVLVAEDTVKVMADFYENNITIDARSRVTLTSDVESDIYLDGKKLGTGTQIVNLHKGNYKVQFKKEGYGVIDRSIEVKNSEELVSVRLRKVTPGSLKVSAVGSDIYIGDEKIGFGSAERELNPGFYQITVKRDGLSDDTKLAKIEPAKVTTLTFTPHIAKGTITVRLVDFSDKISLRHFATMTERGKKLSQSSGNRRIDGFFGEVESVNEKVENLSSRLARMQSYLILMAKEPDMLFRESQDKDYQQLLDFSYSYLNASGNIVVDLKQQTLSKLTLKSFDPLLANVEESAKEVQLIQKDFIDLESQIRDLSERANELSNQTAELPPMKVSSVTSDITKAIKQLQITEKNIAQTINNISTTIELSGALIAKKEMRAKITIPREGRGLSFIDDVALIIDEEQTEFRSSYPFSLNAAKYTLDLDSEQYRLREQNDFIIKMGNNPDAIFFVDDIFKLQGNHKFWRKNSTIALSISAVALGAVATLDIMASSYKDDYDNATGPKEHREAWDNLDKSIDARDTTLYISIVPITYAAISIYNQITAGRKLK